jgi:hypothetical protein
MDARARSWQQEALRDQPMHELVGGLTRSDYLGIIAIAVAVLGAVAAIGAAVYIARRSRPELSWSANMTPLLGPQILREPLNVEGTPVRTLSLSELRLWNSGNATLRYESEVVGQIEIVTAPNVHILHVIPNPSDDHLGFALLREAARVQIRFEFLRKRDSCTLTVVHTGDEVSSVGLKGFTRDAGEIKKQPWKGGLPYQLATALPRVLGTFSSPLPSSIGKAQIHSYRVRAPSERIARAAEEVGVVSHE